MSNPFAPLGGGGGGGGDPPRADADGNGVLREKQPLSKAARKNAKRRKGAGADRSNGSSGTASPALTAMASGLGPPAFANPAATRGSPPSAHADFDSFGDFRSLDDLQTIQHQAPAWMTSDANEGVGMPAAAVDNSADAAFPMAAAVAGQTGRGKKDGKLVIRFVPVPDDLASWRGGAELGLSKIEQGSGAR